MLLKDTQIFVSFHSTDESLVLPVLEQIKTAGWCNFNIIGEQTDQSIVLDTIRQSGIALVFLSKTYASDERLMLEKFAYAATVVRKPYIPVWLDSLSDIRQYYQNAGSDQQLLSALEMLTARYIGTTTEKLITALEQYTPNEIPYTPSTPQVCEKPSEAYEGNEPFIFISYAHDDANRVYPIIKELYESGWDLWYDEGIKITERYLPVIAHHVNRCSVIVLMLTNRCLNRPFVMNYELEYAGQRGIPIIPVLLEELEPQPWSKENVDRLMKTAITPDTLFNRIGAVGLVNHGKRTAVPPAIKQNVVYDVVLPPELPGFKFTIQSDEITITRYIGNDTEVVIPGTVTIPDGSVMFRVTAIGDYAFTGGGVLASIVMPDFIRETGKETFNNCKLLTSVTVPDSVNTIGKFAFSGCVSLKNVTIPDSVINIGEDAFLECSQLDAVFNASKTIIFNGPRNWNFKRPYFIPDGVIKINCGAFSGPSYPPFIMVMMKLSCVLQRKKFTDVLAASGWCRLPKNIIIPKSVTEINDKAFKNCASLKNITIPDSVTNIGDNAFYGCEYLKNIIIPDSVASIGEWAFYGCKSLKNITIPDNVTSIGDNAFYGCKSLKKIIIPDSVTYIGYNAFAYTPIESTIPERNFIDDTKNIESKTNKNNQEKTVQFIIPICKETPRAKVCCATFDVHHVNTLLTELYWEGFNIFFNKSSDQQEIEESQCILAFISDKTNESTQAMNILKKAVQYDVSRIIQVFIGDCVELPIEIRSNLHDRQAIIRKNLSEQEFTGKIRDSLRQFGCSLGHPRGFDVNNIGNAVEVVKFHPTDFSQVVIPKTFFDPPLPVMNIGATAFMDCKSITSIVIPDSVTNINGMDIRGGAFCNCESLRSVTLPNSLKNIGGCAFLSCNSLDAITIPDSVTDIGKYSFMSCKLLTEIVIPNSIKRISENAFMLCESLTIVTISEGVTHIDDSAFMSCESLKYVAIPNSITSIGNMVFSSCTSLTYINIPDSVVNIDESAFYNCTSLKGITIPDSVTSIGKNAFDYCESLTIYSPKGSVGWQYAEKNNIKCKPLEDSDVKQNCAELLYNFGHNYGKGKGVPQDLEKANYWYEKAAEQGNANAQCNLGYNYEVGRGVPKDLEKAYYWYEKAAEQGNARAQLNFGLCYENGRGIAKDIEKANYWYAKAAEQGNTRAQSNLGLNYAKGRGVPKDLNIARHWLTLAAEQGYEKAKEALAMLDTE
jgi:hypothetical protein